MPLILGAVFMYFVYKNAQTQSTDKFAISTAKAEVEDSTQDIQDDLNINNDDAVPQTNEIAGATPTQTPSTDSQTQTQDQSISSLFFGHHRARTKMS